MGLRSWARDVLFPPMVVTNLDARPAHRFDAPLRPVDQVISDMLATGWGAKVSRSQALGIPAVLRGRNELCAIGTLPLRQYQGLDIVPSALLRQLDLNVANVVTMSSTIEDLVFTGLAWWQVLGRDFRGFPIAVQRVAPGRVALQPPATPGGNLALTPSGTVSASYSGTVLWLDGKAVPASDFIRFDSPNPGLLQAGARPIRKALLLDQLACVYAANPRPLDYFTDSDRPEVDPFDDDEVQAFLAEWQALRQRSSTGWVPGAVQRIDVATPSPADLQLVELQRQVTLELANALGMDAEDLSVSTTSRTYFNGVDRRQEKINRTYAPYMRAITDRLSMGDVTPRGYEVRFDLTDYLKADPTTQVAYWKGLKDMGAIDAAEVRAAAGWTGAPPAAAQPAATPATTVTASVVQQRALPSRARFDSTPAHTFSATDFAADTPAATVDTESRTITGLALPYGATTQRYGMTYRFQPGSLEYGGDVTRIKHLQDHTTPVGSVVSLEDTPTGLTAKLSVLGGPEGSPTLIARDQLLHDAQHGLYDGLSVGVDFSLYPEDGDVVFHEEDQVYDVVRASLREISTTPMPAFTDARVTKVAASLTGGTMYCQHCGKQHAQGIACATFAAQLTAATPPPAAPTQPVIPAQGGAPAAPPAPTPPPSSGDIAATFAAFAQWLAAHQSGAAPTNGPVLVDPSGRALFQVVEPPPYRFDRKGNLGRGSHDFSSDLVAGFKDGDQAARDRAETFATEAFTSGNVGRLDPPTEAFAITPANVTNLNYPANRPDLYVDQMDYLYPMYDGTFSGTLTEVTPFVVPKFGTSSGLVADHITGTEPTPGAFTATAQTITPSAVSGKVEVTREAFDQGGNPQMSGLIWRQMTRGWYEALEAFVQAQLTANAASITDIVVGVSTADSILDQSLTGAILPLQYIRGGNRYSKVYTQVDLYTAMGKAKDANGRRLYPSLGAQNAVGMADPRWAYIAAHGMTWVPAWATAASSASATSSWMFDPDAVHLWASAPQRIDMQWRVAWVDIGLFGYKAFAITDFTRTRELVYTR